MKNHKGAVQKGLGDFTESWRGHKKIDLAEEKYIPQEVYEGLITIHGMGQDKVSTPSSSQIPTKASYTIWLHS